MPAHLKFGTSGDVALELEAKRLLAVCGEPAAANLSDVRAATAAALAEPFDFPPLARAIVPGDKVVITIEPDTPRRSAVVAAVIDVLLSAGVEPSDVVILQAAEAAACDPTELLAPELRQAIGQATHDPHDAGQFRYLASTQSGERVYLHHTIVDADVLVPIGCSRCTTALTWLDDLDGVYPTFSNQETRLRFRRPLGGGGGKSSSTKLAEEAREAMWLLGAIFGIQVIPGTGDEALAFWAGGFDAVRTRALAEAERHWTWPAPRQAGLVVAGVSGGPGQQTWRNVGRALAAAARVVAQDGAIAICTELEAPPGMGLKRIGQADDLHAALRAVQRERSDDAQETTHLAAALDRARVYFLSRLSDASVEELGMTPLTAPAEIARLAQRHGDCLLLNNAQHAVVRCEKV